MELSAKLANCPIGGELTTDYPDGSWLLDRIELRLGRFRLTIVQNPELIKYPSPKITGKFFPTTTVMVHNLPNDRVDQGKRLIEDLSWLLSFATMSQVRPFQYTWGKRSQGITVQGVTLLHRPTLEIQNGETVRKFLELCWTKYRKLKLTRKLPEVIHYIVDAETPGTFEEGRLLYVFVAMENLKSTYADSKGYILSKGSFQRASSTGKMQRLGFRDLLEEMLGEVGMRRGLKRAVQLRNEIIHYGLSHRPFSSLQKYYESCQDMIREYLLRLMGYHGPFEDYTDRSTVKYIQPPRKRNAR